MADGYEVRKNARCLSLYLFLESREVPVTRKDIERNVEGYDGLAAGLEAPVRNLARDIQALENVAIKIDSQEAITGEHLYKLKTSSTISEDVELSAQDQTVLSLAINAVLDDPSFPMQKQLALASMKLHSVLPLEYKAATPPTQEDPTKESFTKLQAMIDARKNAAFVYTKPDGSASTRVVEPYALFSISKEFYLIGRDVNVEQTPKDNGIREFKLGRMSNLKRKNNNAAADFDPVHIKVQDYFDFPFAFGTEEPFLACFLIPKGVNRQPEYLWRNRAALLPLAGQADFELMVAWARSTQKAALWCAEHSSHTIPLGPPPVVEAFHKGLHAAAGLPTEDVAAASTAAAMDAAGAASAVCAAGAAGAADAANTADAAGAADAASAAGAADAANTALIDLEVH